MRRIAILTAGGDTPALNATIFGAVERANQLGIEVLGLIRGFSGMIDPRLPHVRLNPLFSTIPEIDPCHGGTLIGASRTYINPEEKQLIAEVAARAKSLGIEGLVCIGGDGTLTIANQLHKHGIPVVGVPKTIDNDVLGTETTFGFDSAVSCATDALDRLHSTAESHGRIMVLEVMGRYAGWIAAYAGLSGGADVILIPEIPFQYESICRKVKDRAARGRNFTMIVAAEGACPCGGELVTSTAQEANREARLGGVGNMIAAELQKLTGQEARCVVLGHLQRGGSPTAIDRALCTMFGTKAVELIADGRTGRMVSFIGGRITSMPLEEAGGGIRTVPTDSGLVKTARAIGVCFGD